MWIHNLTACKEASSKWIKYLRLGQKSIKYIEDKGQNFPDSGLKLCFQRCYYTVRERKLIINNWKYMNFKGLYLRKRNYADIKRCPTD